MSTVSPGQVQLTGAGTGVHDNRLLDDEAIRHEFADGLARVGIGDLAELVGVEPDFVLAATHYISGEPLLRSQVDPVGKMGI